MIRKLLHNRSAVTASQLPQTEPKESFVGDIYVMPKEFYEPIRSARGGRLTWLFLILGLILIAFGIGIGYVFLIQGRSSPANKNGTAVKEGAAVTVPEQQVGVVQQDESAVATEPATATSSVATTTPPVSSPAPVVSAEEKPLPASVDIDKDGLTDIEEVLLGTDRQVADTDGDGFLDGSELLAGYDPSQPLVTLEGSSLFQPYVNEDPAFEILIPTAWKREDNSGDSTVARFVALNGDNITITLSANNPPFSLEAWFEERYPERDITALAQDAFGSSIGLRSPNEREVYINLGETVVTITYDVGKKAEVAYPTVWKFILQTFKER